MQWLQRPGIRRIREEGLECIVLLLTDGKACFEDKPLDNFIAWWGCEAALVAEVIALHHRAKCSHEIHWCGDELGPAVLHVMVIFDVWQEQLLQQRILFGADVEEDTCDKNVIVLVGSRTPMVLFLVHEVKLSCMLVAIDNVLRGHVKFDLSEEVVVSCHLNIAYSEVTDTVELVLHLQSVTIVHNTHSGHRMILHSI